MKRYINPCSDFGFKKMFGDDSSKDILIDFLNQLLPEKHQIAELTFSNTEKLSTIDEDRKAIFDIHCIASNGERFIIEMQKVKKTYFKDRTLYYLTFPISEQSQRGKWNFELQPVYFIGILDFIFDGFKDNFLQHIELKNQDNKPFYDKLGIIYVQLPAFKKTLDQLETKIDKWIYFLKNLESFESIPQIFNEPVFKHAIDIAEFSKLSLAQQELYDRAISDYVTEDELIEIGREEGREEGREQGERKKALEIAKSMIDKVLPISMIMEITGLTEQEIEEL